MAESAPRAELLVVIAVSCHGVRAGPGCTTVTVIPKGLTSARKFVRAGPGMLCMAGVGGRGPTRQLCFTASPGYRLIEPERAERADLFGFLCLDAAWVFGHADPMGPTGKPHQAVSPAAFPAVDGRTLLGADMALPADFPADRTLAVVAFKQHQQPQVDRWIARAVAAGVPATSRGTTGPLPVAVVEVPVLSTRWRPVRSFIDGGMTRGIGDLDVLARTITVYTDVAVFQRFLAIPSSNEVHALVVDRDGTILARGCGEPDDTSWPAIAGALPVD